MCLSPTEAWARDSEQIQYNVSISVFGNYIILILFPRPSLIYTKYVDFTSSKEINHLTFCVTCRLHKWRGFHPPSRPALAAQRPFLNLFLSRLLHFINGVFKLNSCFIVPLHSVNDYSIGLPRRVLIKIMNINNWKVKEPTYEAQYTVVGVISLSYSVR